MAEQVDTFPLSHSSASKMQSCKAAYWHYKCNKTPYDEDYTISDALSVGKAFHFIQEETKHEKVENLTAFIDRAVAEPDIQMPEKYRCLIRAMTIKYWRLHKQSGFKIIALETGIHTPSTIGYVDALMFDPDGKWWIIDLKANRTLNLLQVKSLAFDPQLNLYASFASMFAEKYDLDIKDFAGCRWRVTTKPTLKQRAGEDNLDYVKRLLKSVRSYDIAIPIEWMNPELFSKRHSVLYKESLKIRKLKTAPMGNYGNCMSYFSPCEYWSQCHNKVFSEETEIITEVQ